jgi:hypothetical protein
MAKAFNMPLEPVRDWTLRVRMSLSEREMLSDMMSAYGMDASNTIRQILRDQHDALIHAFKKRKALRTRKAKKR